MTAGAPGRLQTGPDREDVPPVVLVHGSPDRARSFRRVMALLPDLAVEAYDRRGFGERVLEAPAATGLADHAADLAEVIGGRRVTLVAHSYGCNVALTCAARYPDLVASVGLWEPPMAWAPWWPDDGLRQQVVELAAVTDTRALGESFGRMVLGDERWEGLSERQREQLRGEGAAFRVDMEAELTPPLDIADIHAPLVVAHGTLVGLGHTEGATGLAERLGGELIAVEGADHYVHTSRPEVFADLVRRAVALAVPERDLRTRSA